MTKPHSIWLKLHRYPPLLVRLLAKDSKGRLRSDAELVKLSNGGLTRADIARLSFTASWDEVPVRLMRQFLLVCNVDFADAKRMRSLNRYLKTAGFRHLLNDTHKEELISRLDLLLHR